MAIDVREQTIERTYVEDSPWEFLFTNCDEINGEKSHATTYIVKYSELGTELKKYGCPEELFILLNTGIGQCVTIGFPQGMYSGLIITRIR